MQTSKKGVEGHHEALEFRMLSIKDPKKRSDKGTPIRAGERILTTYLTQGTNYGSSDGLPISAGTEEHADALGSATLSGVVQRGIKEWASDLSKDRVNDQIEYATKDLPKDLPNDLAKDLIKDLIKS